MLEAGWTHKLKITFIKTTLSKRPAGFKHKSEPKLPTPTTTKQKKQKEMEMNGQDFLAWKVIFDTGLCHVELKSQRK